MTQLVLALVLGVLFALGTFLVLRRDLVRVVWGVTLMSQGANVYLVTMGGVSPGDVAPIVHEGTTNSTDPLVQALVLTAIVIGFGTTAFALVLTYRVYQEHGTIDLDDVAAAPAAVPGAPETTGGEPATEGGDTATDGGDTAADGGVTAAAGDGVRDGGDAPDESGGTPDGGETDG